MTCFLEIVFLFRTMLNKGRGYCQTYNFPKNIFWKTTYFNIKLLALQVSLLQIKSRLLFFETIVNV